MSASRSVATKIDWSKLISQLGLRGNTAASLTAFIKRNEQAKRRVEALSALPQNVDFAYYRSVIKNTAVVDEIERRCREFKPTTVDVASLVKDIESFEAIAVQSARETQAVAETHLKDLQATLTNIKEARSFDDLTVDEVAAARPDIDQRTEQLVSQGKWGVPGYKEKFGDLAVL